MQPRYEVPEDGIKELRIWSRTWDRNFTVDVEWVDSAPEMGEEWLVSGTSTRAAALVLVQVVKFQHWRKC